VLFKAGLLKLFCSETRFETDLTVRPVHRWPIC